jgi:hypothetical protein
MSKVTAASEELTGEPAMLISKSVAENFATISPN